MLRFGFRVASSEAEAVGLLGSGVLGLRSGIRLYGQSTFGLGRYSVVPGFKMRGLVLQTLDRWGVTWRLS